MYNYHVWFTDLKPCHNTILLSGHYNVASHQRIINFSLNILKSSSTALYEFVFGVKLIPILSWLHSFASFVTDRQYGVYNLKNLLRKINIINAPFYTYKLALPASKVLNLLNSWQILLRAALKAHSYLLSTIINCKIFTTMITYLFSRE